MRYPHPVFLLVDLARAMGEPTTSSEPEPRPPRPSSYELTIAILDHTHGEVIECRELRGAQELAGAARELRELDGAGRLLWSRLRALGGRP